MQDLHFLPATDAPDRIIVHDPQTHLSETIVAFGIYAVVLVVIIVFDLRLTGQAS